MATATVVATRAMRRATAASAASIDPAAGAATPVAAVRIAAATGRTAHEANAGSAAAASAARGIITLARASTGTTIAAVIAPRAEIAGTVARAANGLKPARIPAHRPAQTRR